MRRTKSVHQPRSTGRLRACFYNTAHLEFGENGEMKSKVKATPDGYRGATPYLTVKNAASAIEFYQRAFGATELFRHSDPSVKIGHAEIKTGEAVPMLSVEYPEMNVLSPETIGGSPIGIHLYVEDVDAVVKDDPSVRRRGGLRRQDNNVRAWAKAVRGTELPVIDSGAAVPVPLNDAILQRHFAA